MTCLTLIGANEFVMMRCEMIAKSLHERKRAANSIRLVTSLRQVNPLRITVSALDRQIVSLNMMLILSLSLIKRRKYVSEATTLLRHCAQVLKREGKNRSLH